MKKINFVGLLAATVVIASTFSACEKDEGSKPAGGNPVSITSVSPTSDLAVGTEVTIKGVSLDSAIAVSFAKSEALHWEVAKSAFKAGATATEIKVSVPAGVQFPCYLAVVVSATRQVVYATPLTAVVDPNAIAITSNSSTDGGTLATHTVKFEGVNFDKITEVKLDGTAQTALSESDWNTDWEGLEAYGYWVKDAATLYVRVPENAPKGVNIAVTINPGNITETIVMQAPPASVDLVATNKTVGTKSDNVKAIYAPYVAPGDQFVVEATANETFNLGTAFAVYVGDTKITDGTYPKGDYDNAPGNYVACITLPPNAEIGSNYEFVIKDGDTEVASVVIQARLSVLEFTNPDFDWNQGIGHGGWKDVGTVARAGTDYYYEYEGTAFNGWKTFVAAGTFSDVFGTAGITSADNLVFNFKMRDGGIDTAIVLKLRIQTPNNDYWYEWPVGEQIATFADNDWHTVTLPLSNFDAAFVLDGLSQFCIANANANPVVDDPSTDEDETSDGLKPHGVGKDLNFNVDNVRFEKQ